MHQSQLMRLRVVSYSAAIQGMAVRVTPCTKHHTVGSELWRMVDVPGEGGMLSTRMGGVTHKHTNGRGVIVLLGSYPELG